MPAPRRSSKSPPTRPAEHPAPLQAPPSERMAQQFIERLRAARVHPDRAVALGPLMHAQLDALARAARSIGPAGRAWARHCPPDLLPHTTVLALARGTLRVGVQSTAARFALDRWLRAGGAETLLRAAGVPIKRITLVPHATEPADDPTPTKSPNRARRTR